MPALERMAAGLRGAGFEFVFVYTGEAHPGELHGPHTDLDMKVRHAEHMVKRFDMKRAMLVDDLEGTIHRAYGTLPNMSYVVARGGKIAYRAGWTDERTIGLAVDQLVFEGQKRSERIRMLPYYMEWMPSRESDVPAFLAGLLEFGGPRALREYIDAVEKVRGVGVANPMRKIAEQLPRGA